jgi:hypothetical protein
VRGPFGQDLVEPRELAALVGAQDGVATLIGHFPQELPHGGVHLEGVLALQGFGVGLPREDVAHLQGVSMMLVLVPVRILAEVHEVGLQTASGPFCGRVPQGAGRRTQRLRWDI